jgi:hypothetical protein
MNIPNFDYETLISESLARITTAEQIAELKNAIAKIKDRI